jgi:DNA-binding LacI/PurR family transcriptional regulator
VAGDIGRLIEDQHVTAVVCHDDGYADDVSHVARNLGLVPGADLALVGFDDSDIARRAQPALRSVAQPITAVAELVWRALLAQLAGSGEGPFQQIVSPELVVRASSDWRLGEPEAAS